MSSVIRVSFLLFSAVYSLPEKWTVCQRDLPAYNKCIKDATNFAIHHLASESEQYGLPPLDPLSALDYSIITPPGPISVNASIKNSKLTGFKDSRIEDIETDWKTMNITLKTDSVNLICDAVLNLKLLNLPIFGSGKIKGTLENPTLMFFMKLGEKQIQGKQHYHVDACNFNLKDSKAMKVQIGDLFGKNRDFGEKMNKALNENLGLLINEIQGPIQDGIGRNVRNYANKVFAKFSKDEITPPRGS